MNVVLDTNVVVSALLSPAGTCARILLLAMDGAFEPQTDERLLREYEEVLCYPRLGIDPTDRGHVMAFFRTVADRVVALPLAADLPDPDDVCFLEVAAASGAILVTGNLRHYPESQRCGVRVLTPAEFLELLRKGGASAGGT